MSEVLNILYEAAAFALILFVRSFNRTCYPWSVCIWSAVFDGFQHTHFTVWFARYQYFYGYRSKYFKSHFLWVGSRENMLKVDIQQAARLWGYFFLVQLDTAYLIFMIIATRVISRLPGVANYIACRRYKHIVV